MAVAYPEHRDVSVVLRDGSTVQVRPVRPDDVDAVREMLDGLSVRSRWFRFFSAGVDLGQAAKWACDVDHHDRYGLVALSGTDHRVIAHAAYARLDPEAAEVAFAIADDYQGRGLGTQLLGQLAEAAEENGVARFEAEVLPENREMARVFRESGFPVSSRAEPGAIFFEFPASLTPEVLDRFENRERIAAAAALAPILAPRSVAVIGASRERGTISGELFHNLVSSGFPGVVYPVNPAAPAVQSVPSYARVLDIPGEVDLAVVTVPAELVLGVARECAEKGVRGIVVISSGFGEIGGEGSTRQAELVEICRAVGMRMIGPNCMGVLNTDPAVRLDATFAPDFPPAGNVGFLSQSGALGLAVIAQAAELSLGLSAFVSVGDKADLSGNDLLQYWEDDERTDVVLLYLESFGNARRFARLARRISRTKPIVVVKSGRSQAGARATSSHTGAMLAASDVTVDALFTQAGVIRTNTLEEMFHVAALLSTQPLPRGPRVAIVTNAGGPGILCADACEGFGVEVPALSEETRARLAQELPPHSGLSNPVDMTAGASAGAFANTLRVIAASGEVDALIAIFIPPLVTDPLEVAAAIRDAQAELHDGVPLIAVFMTTGPSVELLREARIPTFGYPEHAAHALAHAMSFVRRRDAEHGAVPEFPDIRREDAAAVIAEALAAGRGWLEPAELTQLMGCYGVGMVESRIVTTPEQAAAAARGLSGDAVALKAIAPGLLHKTDSGGVRLGVAPDEVQDAAAGIAAAVREGGFELEGLQVQRMAAPGVEMLLGVVHDRDFGPVLACGAGGTAVELLGDVAVRLTPLRDRDAHEMLRELRTFKLLDGYRGAPPADVAAVEELLLRLSALVEDHPAIAELDCNPVIVGPAGEGATVVDARVRVAPPPPRRPRLARAVT